MSVNFLSISSTIPPTTLSTICTRARASDLWFCALRVLYYSTVYCLVLCCPLTSSGAVFWCIMSPYEYCTVFRPIWLSYTLQVYARSNAASPVAHGGPGSRSEAGLVRLRRTLAHLLGSTGNRSRARFSRSPLVPILLSVNNTVGFC